MVTVTYFSPVLLQACLRRDGIWLVDAETSRMTDFYHRRCYPLSKRTMPSFEIVSKEEVFDEMEKFINGEPSMFVGCPTGENDGEEA